MCLNTKITLPVKLHFLYTLSQDSTSLQRYFFILTYSNSVTVNKPCFPQTIFLKAHSIMRPWLRPQPTFCYAEIPGLTGTAPVSLTILTFTKLLPQFFSLEYFSWEKHILYRTIKQTYKSYVSNFDLIACVIGTIVA